MSRPIGQSAKVDQPNTWWTQGQAGSPSIDPRETNLSCNKLRLTARPCRTAMCFQARNHFQSVKLDSTDLCVWHVCLNQRAGSAGVHIYSCLRSAFAASPRKKLLELDIEYAGSAGSG